LNPSAYSQLWFGLNFVDMGQNGGYGLYDLTNVVLDGSTLFLSNSNVCFEVYGGSVCGQGTLQATLNTGSWITPPAGITGPDAPLAVTDVTGTAFSVTVLFTLGGSSYDSIYNEYNTLSIQSQTDYSGDFWYEPLAETGVATPLPAAFPLFATGLGGLGLLGWRRKRRAQAAA
jgi:hypothetical protein